MVLLGKVRAAGARELRRYKLKRFLDLARNRARMASIGLWCRLRPVQTHPFDAARARGDVKDSLLLQSRRFQVRIPAKGGVATSGRRQVLNFNMQRQAQTNWCWAGVTVSIARFYDAGTTWTQCSLADAELGRSDCCGAAGSGPCNQYWYLHTPLQRVDHLDWTGAASAFSTVVAEIDAGDPLGCRTAWSGGGAHFVVIYGYADSDPAAGTPAWLWVDDPWDGKSDVSYSVFRNRYAGSGTWTHSYGCRR